MRTYLTFNQNARLFGWMVKHKEECALVTGQDPMLCFSKPIANQDLGPLPYTHADFTPRIQWWLKKHCPYKFVRTGKAKNTLKLLIMNYLKYKKK